MNICSCVVHTRPEEARVVEARLVALPGVDIHGGQAEGRLVVTVEDTEQALAADTLGAINATKGVISTVLIYHYGGEDLTAEEVTRESHSA
jgi:nitrate reductase NapD